MKKRTMKLFLLSAGALVVLTGSFLVYGIYSFMTSPLFGEEPDDQPDEVLIANFQEHRAEFEQLREMVMRDTTMTRVDDTWTAPTNFSPDTVDEYRRLFKVVGTKRGVSASKNRDSIEFISSIHGWAVSSSAKGYAYLKERPKKVVKSLNAYGWNTPPDTHIYRLIEGNWYLFFNR